VIVLRETHLRLTGDLISLFARKKWKEVIKKLDEDKKKIAPQFSSLLAGWSQLKIFSSRLASRPDSLD
jgi:hypothetical protein